MTGQERARRVAFWIVAALAAVVTVVAVIDTVTADPHEGEGWIGGPLEFVFAGGPLIAVAVGLRSTRRQVARRTAAVALFLAAVVAFVLVQQLVDANETLRDRLVSVAGVVVYLAVFAVELPLARHRPPVGSRS